MQHWITTAALTAALCGASLGAQASGLDSLRQQAGQLGLGGNSNSQPASGSSALGGLLGGGAASSGVLSALGVPASGTASNAAGVLTYCIKNKYLNVDKAELVKSQLLGKLGLAKQEEPRDQGYLNGLGGMITGQNGQSFNMDKLKSDLKEKACDFVLENAQSLL